MTAIFAYVKDDIAFIGADSYRTTPQGWSFVVTKVHRWSEHILIAQAGYGVPMTKLIYDMMIARDHDYGQYSTLAGLTALFKCLHKQHFNASSNSQSTQALSVQGTLVVANTCDGKTPAQIQSLDLATGLDSLVGLSGNAYAAGSNQSVFQTIADAEIIKITNSGSTIPLDTWASICIQNAASVAPELVNWPADFVISRPINPSCRRCIIQRSQSLLRSSNPDYLI